MSKSYNPNIWDTNSDFTPSRMNHIEQGIEAVDLTGGGTVHGVLSVAKDGTTTARDDTYLIVGNNTPEGTAGNERGVLVLYSKNDKSGYFTASNLTDHRFYEFPDKSGTVAMTTDSIPMYERQTSAANTFTCTIAPQTLYLMVVGANGGNGSMFNLAKIYMIWLNTVGGTDVSYEAVVSSQSSRSITGVTANGNDSFTFTYSDGVRVSLFKLAQP